MAGIAYIRPLDRAALENNTVVKNHACDLLTSYIFPGPHLDFVFLSQYNEAMTAGTAAPISLAAVHSDDTPSFFTRGVGNSTAPSQLTMCVDKLGVG